jgi:FdhD protein
MNKTTTIQPTIPDAAQPELRMAVVPVDRLRDNSMVATTDTLAVEEPLEIRLAYTHAGVATHRGISITMRTPGHDADLACGFLFTEGIIHQRAEIAHARPCGLTSGTQGLRNTIRVTLEPHVSVDIQRLERHFYTNSSCGVCGKTSLAALKVAGVQAIATSSFAIARHLILGMPQRLREAQDVFDQTGGLHAAGLFDSAGNLITLREDVGRHNAVDKLIGNALMSDECPLDQRVLMLSGRASFELIQKALVAGIPIVAAVGAPSSLAVELASQNQMTLIGFVRDRGFNIYCGADRIKL